MATTVECPYCGEEILAKARKCKHCGEWLDKADTRAGGGASDRGSADARAVTKGLKQKELDDFTQKALSFFALVVGVIVGVIFQSFWAGVATVLIGAALIGFWYYKE